MEESRVPMKHGKLQMPQREVKEDMAAYVLSLQRWLSWIFRILMVVRILQVGYVELINLSSFIYTRGGKTSIGLSSFLEGEAQIWH